MTQIKSDKFDAWRKKTSTDAVPQIFLIYGESYLAKAVLEKLLSFLSKRSDTKTATEKMEGGTVCMGEIIEEISTFGFLAKQKIVLVKNIPLFAVNTNSNEIVFSASDHDLLSDFIEKGVPENHTLIFTCPNVDKRKKIYKTIENAGLVLDCSVAQGARKADLDDQSKILRQMCDSILRKAQKKIEPQALLTLMERTGFAPELFAQNLDKLIAYSGNQSVICLQDVNSVIVRDKKDPIFNLTNALIDKDAPKCLFYLQSLLTQGYHPLQILKSFENQIRKLLLVKCFTGQQHPGQGTGFRQMGFNGFKQSVLPAVVARDQKVIKSLEVQQAFIIDTAPKKKKAAVKKTGANDLLLAPNPKNAYPVYQIFLKSEKFSLSVLNQALVVLSDLDFRLKTSAIDSKTQIESFIIHLCSKGGFDYETPEHQNRRHHI